MSGHHHRSSVKGHKAFKPSGGNTSKRERQDRKKGRTGSISSTPSRISSHKSSPLSQSGNSTSSKLARRNLAQQSQANKRASLIASNRIFSSSNHSNSANDRDGLGLTKGLGGAPRIVSVIPLSQDGDAWKAVRELEEMGEEEGIKVINQLGCERSFNEGIGRVELEATRHRQTLQFLPLPYGSLYSTLDSVKCSDFVLLLLSPSTSIDPGSFGELCLRSLQAQGMPTVLCAVQTLIDLSDERVSNLNVKYQNNNNNKKSGPLLKASNETRKSLLSFAKYFAPEVEKIYSLDEKSEKSSLIRTMSTSTPRRVAWRDFRSWLIGEGGSWEPNQSSSSSKDEEVKSDAIQDQKVEVEGEGEQKGTLKIQGWVRGSNISSNRLIHIPDFGDYQIEKILFKPILDEKNSRRFSKLREKRKLKEGEEIKDLEMMDVENGQEDTNDQIQKETEIDLLPDDLLDERIDEFADDLISENEVDDLANEQTWPTEEEMKGHLSFPQDDDDLDDDSKRMPPPAAPGTTPFKIEKNGKSQGKGKGKNKGEGILSEKYKAAWIVESDEEEDDDLDDDLIEEEEKEDLEMMEKEPELGVDSEILSGDEEVATEMGFDEDEEEYQLALKAYSEERSRLKSEREDLNFPDEVDTPLTISARKRFERYRGLKSFRTSPWDPYEDLPLDYSKIFQFDDWKRSKKRVESNLLEEGVKPGTRVEIWIKDTPQSLARRARVEGFENRSKVGEVDELVPFTLFGLMRHEHKKSVLNFTCTRNTEFDGTVKSKDPLILSLGPRRFKINPIFSQHTRSTGSNNVHKFERFLRPGVGSISVCSIFAPVTFGSPSAVLFKERSLEGMRGYDQRGVGARQMPYLIGSGNLLNAEPTRINAKRIVLTGHPFKVHKKTATIRFMFFSPEDVRYFQPVTLHTKYGRTGHIKDSLGTHGYFKAHFDGPINQMDTIMLTLYKRVYPKWCETYRDSRDEMPLRISREEEIEVGNRKGLKEDQRLGWNEMQGEKENGSNVNGAGDEDEEMQG